MRHYQIDINCDVGEGVGNEKELMPLISSCNISCGAHAGDESTIRQTIQLAIKNKVKIGAHPSFPDKENFGRKVLNMPPASFKASIQEQLNGFSKILNEEKGELHHIKPHGALYNEIAKNKELAQLFLEAILTYKDYVKLFVPSGSEIAYQAARKGYDLVYEAFADRNYNTDLSLVSRTTKSAVIQDEKKVLEHVLRMVKGGEVKTIENNRVPIRAETFCVHGDTPAALKILMYLEQELPKHQVYIKK